ncbi:hypothetical protein D3C87_1575730 [compost metagenome]
MSSHDTTALFGSSVSAESSARISSISASAPTTASRANCVSSSTALLRVKTSDAASFKLVLLATKPLTASANSSYDIMTSLIEPIVTN